MEPVLGRDSGEENKRVESSGVRRNLKTTPVRRGLRGRRLDGRAPDAEKLFWARNPSVKPASFSSVVPRAPAGYGSRSRGCRAVRVVGRARRRPSATGLVAMRPGRCVAVDVTTYDRRRERVAWRLYKYGTYTHKAQDSSRRPTTSLQLASSSAAVRRASRRRGDTAQVSPRRTTRRRVRMARRPWPLGRRGTSSRLRRRSRGRKQ